MRDAQLARFRVPALVLLVAILVAALSLALARGERPAQPRPSAYIYPDTIGAYDARDALTRLDGRIAAEERLIRPDDWLSRAQQAERWLDRARLSGDFADYARALNMIEAARTQTRGTVGPDLSDAVIDLAVHRYAAAAAALDRIDRYPQRSAVEEASARAMRGDIAFYRGDPRGAFLAWNGASQLIRLALLYQRIGEPERALTALDEARRAPRFITAQAAANIAYQRGLVELQRGRWPQAEAAFAEADRLFANHWLFLQARAQMRGVAGDLPSAIALYRRAIGLTGNPETMDALATLHRAQGDRANAEAWAGRAGAIWARWTRLLPEAAFAHALDHELAFGTPRRAAALAVRSWRARPYGASATALGWALLANGRAADASRLIDALNASGWATAEQHIVGAQAAEMRGDTVKAESERAAALALNPRAFDRAASMIWIGH